MGGADGAGPAGGNRCAPFTCEAAERAGEIADNIDIFGEFLAIVFDFVGGDGEPGPGPVTAATMAGRAKRIERAAERAREVTKRMRVCFPAGTQVSTPDGERPIESLKEGDEVFAYDFDTNAVVIRRVGATFQRQSTRLIRLQFGDESIEATVSHPFWVYGRGWVEAGDLAAGMALSGRDGNRKFITQVETRTGPVAVFNFEVEGEHNYFVGHDAVLVHNQNVVDTDFNRATNVALQWLRSQGVDTSRVTGAVNGRPFSPHAGKPIGVSFEGGGYYRVEFDARSGAHINVGVKKVKGPHIRFEGTQKTVNNLVRRLFRC